MKPQYTKSNRDEYSNIYRVTIRIGMRVLHWSSYDLDHLEWRVERAGYRYFASGWSIEDAGPA